MADKMYIKQLYEDGVSKSEIQRRTKLNYCTVCKYADMVDWNDDKLPNMEPDNYPVLGEYILLINEWLEGEAAAPRKQRHTAKRIYDRLRAEAGYKGGYSSLKRYVCKSVSYCVRDSQAACRLHTLWLMPRLTSENFCTVTLRETNTRRMSLSCRSRIRIKPMHRCSRHRIRSAC